MTMLGHRIAQRRDKVERCHVTRGLLGEVTIARLHSGAAASTAAWSSSKVAGVAPHVAHLGLAERRKERVLAKARRAVEQGPPRTAKRQQVVIEQLVTAVTHADILARHAMPRRQARRAGHRTWDRDSG